MTLTDASYQQQGAEAPEPDDWDDYADAAFCGSCGFLWDDCACDRHVPRVDETEGNSLSEERLEWEERG